MQPHEVGIFSFYACAGAIANHTAQGHVHGVHVQSAVALTWSGMVLGVSFLEAWVKFRASFLRKYIAVDVGRHVFAALNAAELALAISLWTNKLMM